MRSKVLLAGLLLSLPALAYGEVPGEAPYKKTCILCHGADGKGKTKMGLSLAAADLTSPDIQALSDAAIEHTVRNGKGKMPSFEKTLTPAEITSVVQYVRTLHK